MQHGVTCTSARVWTIPSNEHNANTCRSSMPTESSPPQKHVLLYFTHVFNERHMVKFKALRDAFSPYGETFTLFYSENSDLIAPADFNAHGTDRPTLNSLGYRWMHHRLMPGHANFPLMHFAQCHPDYASYTLLEFDVELTGSWGAFFEHCMRDDADFLATHLADQNEQPDWFFWDTLKLPQGPLSKKSNHSQLRFFGPIYRISNRAIKSVHAAYKEGAIGHCETLLPTVVSDNGFICRDINDIPHPNSRRGGRWYTKQAHDPAGKLKKSSMRFRPNRLFPGWKTLTLYHPVKFGKGERLDHLRRKLAELFRLKTSA